MTYTDPNLRNRTMNRDYHYNRDFDYTRIPSDLQRLDNLDNYKIADDEPDPRGYDVIGADGDTIGQIDGLLASPSLGKALFAIIDTGGWFNSKKFVLPLDRINFDTNDEQATVPFTKADFQAAPEYDEDNPDYRAYYSFWSGRISDEDTDRFWQDRFHSNADTAMPAATPPPKNEVRTEGTLSEVRVPVTEETAEVRRANRRIGYVNLRKNVETETKHISEPVTRTNVTVETVDVADRAYNPADGNVNQLRDGETLRIPVVEEDVQVVKTPHVTKEVIVRAEAERDTMEKDVELRRENVVVDEEGDVDVERTAPLPRR